MTEEEQKAAFAAFLLVDPSQPFEAALKLFPSDRERGRACQVTFAWPDDPFVIEEMERLKSSPTYSNPDIPSKLDLIKSAKQLADNVNVAPKERIAALRLIAELQAFIVKAEAQNDNNRRMPSMPVYKVVSE